ncbi:MAG: polyribonucleotide nucleotidyltransferase [candidate division Zixibacteria bacterium 4484_93]|nr:MAG: polyribonucleotide nucleotidyltransferase [candidate division Zixibacteria bacterium 4484_93]
MEVVEREIMGKLFSIETGKVARQANGSVVVRLGGTVVLVAACASKEPKEGIDFFPLTVEYRERQYAAGQIPGGFFKREGRPTEREILCARLIDRPLRPLFPDGMRNEIQITSTVISFDQENDSDILGIIGASTALCISDIPFDGPVGAVRVGLVGDEFILNPTFLEREESLLDIVVAGTKENVVMVEGSASEIPEEKLTEALRFAHSAIVEIIGMESELVDKVGREKFAFEVSAPPEEMITRVEKLATPGVIKLLSIPGKKLREEALSKLVDSVRDAVSDDFPDDVGFVPGIIHDIERQKLRRMILEDGRRIDGRAPTDIRPITVEVGIIPRAHGSALFTRGETQSLGVLTLGTKLDEQRIENLEGESSKRFMLHYNFPPFSVGETRPIRGPSRREIGHGHLAEMALSAVIPNEETFPYTIRIVSDILESNGSSSMATVCSGSLALMDAGVSVKAAVAGISMGLVKEDNREVILTDIIGAEDHNGDMDFKVAGTANGVTAFQMDVKVKGLSFETISAALKRARDGRMFILEKMNQVISRPRESLSVYAPRITTLRVNPDKIGEIIGTGGKVIRAIQERTGTTISIDDTGLVQIAAYDETSSLAALKEIESIVEEAEVGKVYEGTVKRITPYGAFVEILPNTDGLLHISEIEHRRINRVEDVLKVGGKVTVKVIGIDDSGRIKLSRKALIKRENSGARRYERKRND